jgi:hypothetical protein
MIRPKPPFEQNLLSAIAMNRAVDLVGGPVEGAPSGSLHPDADEARVQPQVTAQRGLGPKQQ